MDTSLHTIEALFQQLGLPADQQAIADFVGRHRPLAQTVHLPDAPFWTAAQAAFLREAWREDAEWCEAVDGLDARLRH